MKLSNREFTIPYLTILGWFVLFYWFKIKPSKIQIMDTQLHDCQYINQPAFQATSMLVTDVGDKKMMVTIFGCCWPIRVTSCHWQHTTFKIVIEILSPMSDNCHHFLVTNISVATFWIQLNRSFSRYTHSSVFDKINYIY